LGSILPQNRKVHKEIKYIGSFENRGKTLPKLPKMLYVASASITGDMFFIVYLPKLPTCTCDV
jgi:hypothetical protein